MSVNQETGKVIGEEGEKCFTDLTPLIFVSLGVKSLLAAAYNHVRF